MFILAPSILAADFSKLGEDIKAVSDAKAGYLHIDVMDGVFVPSISFGMPVIESIRKCSDILFDVHLMIVNPIRYVEEFKRIGADRITIHVEACDNVRETLVKINELGLKAGISLKPNTPVEEIEQYLDCVDMVLVMTVEPGFGGQTYIETSDDKIRQIRNLVESKNLPINIAVDGGVNKENAKDILDAGANVLVAGSAVFNDDIKKNVADFHAIFENN